VLERAELSAPCVAKPVMGHVGRRVGDFATRLLPDAAAVRAHIAAAMDAGIPMLVSEHVPGPTTALEGAITLRAADGTWPLEAGRRKIRDYDHGVGSVVEAWAAVESIERARRILEEADYVGLAATEFKRHAVTGVLYLIEINVRVPQYFGVYEAAGVDAAWRLYATLAGLPVGAQPPLQEGARVWMPQHDLHVVRQMRRARPVGLREIVAPLAGVRDFGALSWRDPGPALELARAEWSRAWRKLGGAAADGWTRRRRREAAQPAVQASRSSAERALTTRSAGTPHSTARSQPLPCQSS
jgi:predicted ATP-grasp superfamily ATP-dependent carboligase